MSGAVICPATITSPAPDPATGMPPNVPCGLEVPVRKRAPVMEFRCPRGHAFYATEAEILEREEAGRR